MTAAARKNASAKTYYALGWDYSSAVTVLLKYLHASPAIPFKISGIVHNETWADEIDEIPLITSKDFINTKLPDDSVLLPFSMNSHWKELLINSLPDSKPAVQNIPSLVRDLAADMEKEKLSGIPIGPLLFPDVFVGQDELKIADNVHFEDEHSKRVYECYLNFLNEPSWLSFESVLSPVSVNYYDPDWVILGGFTDRERPSAVVELTSHRSTLPEQFYPFMGPMSRYYLLAEGPHAVKEQVRHKFLIDRIKGDFLRIKTNLSEIPPKVWDHDKSMLIINKPLSVDDSKAIAALQPTKNRIVMYAGFSASAFRNVLDLSLRVHPNGVRRLRISGRYPNSLLMFSAPAEDKVLSKGI